MSLYAINKLSAQFYIQFTVRWNNIFPQSVEFFNQYSLMQSGFLFHLIIYQQQFIANFQRPEWLKCRSTKHSLGFIRSKQLII